MVGLVVNIKPVQSPTYDSDHYGDQSSYRSPTDSPIKLGEDFLESPVQAPARPDTYKIWFGAIWPLLLHGVLAVVIVISILAYVNGHNFNISERRPNVRLNNGTVIPWAYYTPLQSDITTLLSISIAILRLAAAIWVGSLCWRCAFILMEEVGLTPKSLRHLISYSITSVPVHGVAERKRVTSLLILVTLALTIPSHLSAPILTGAITWVPGHHDPELLSNSTISTALYDGSTLGWDTEGYNAFWSPSADELFLRLEAARRAGSFSYMTWEREEQINTLRRYLPGLSLEVNSTLTNITIPYLSVQSIEWINNPATTLGIDQLDIRSIFCPRIAEATYVYCPIITGLALFPNFDWYNQTNIWPPPPKLVADRWLTTTRVGSFTNNSETQSGCTFEYGFYGTHPSLTDIDHAVFVDSHNWCYAFAWVNFTAGVTTCHNCLVSSRGTIQNTTSLSPREDFFTEYALRLVLDASAEMANGEFLNMGPPWDSIDEYVAGMLARAYAGSWMSITETLAYGITDNTTYSLSTPSSRASVSTLRVYIWLALQALIALSGALFVYIQSRTGTTIISDTTLAAFYLDTRAVYQQDKFKVPVLRRVEFEGDRLRLKPEQA